MSFPKLTIVKASAGSGKTYFLTRAYVEYLLSKNLKNNDLKNILAITFSNNAAIEIKEKIIDWLKKLYFKQDTAIKEFRGICDSEEEIGKRAELIIEKILENYSEFQVRTIDSFLTKIFKAESIRFGYPDDFEIIMNPKNFLNRAFEIFLSKFNDNSPDTESLMRVIKDIEDNLSSQQTYMWNPSKRIFGELQNIYRIVSKSSENPDEEIYSKLREYQEKYEETKRLLKDKAKNFLKLLENNGKISSLKDRTKRILNDILKENYSSALESSFNKIPISSPNAEILEAWEELRNAFALYVTYYAMTYFSPYLYIFHAFESTVKKLKLREQKIFIDDVNKLILNRINSLSIPEVFIKIGERIYHYLIDEFQDTSPVQWENLKILIENSLSEGGSLLVVGDTKQAIYGFRGADYSIMAELVSEASKPLKIKSVKEYEIYSLDTNYRSGERIINFVKEFYKTELKDYLLKRADSHDKIAVDENGVPLALSLSGLYECEQKIRDNLKDIGFVKIEKVEYEKEEKEEVEKKALLEILERLTEDHGFSYSDIAILAFKNSTLKQMSTWLNEQGIEFISLSSLDIRNRKVISEIICLIRFLESPIDDFAFAVFLLGEAAERNFKEYNQNWRKELEKFLFKLRKNQSYEPYYKKFKEKFPLIWDSYFSELLKKTGYLPLYDIVTEIYSRFRLFEVFPEEEAALIKFLEIVLSFEAEGGGLRKFIEFYETSGEEDESFWDTSKPTGKNHITLMTVHKAKGLEFPAVILFTDMDITKQDRIVYKGGNFLKIPSKDAVKNSYLKELLEIKNQNYNKNLTEELNKLYVGLTRAKEVLYVLISCEKTQGKEQCPRKHEAVKCLFELESRDADTNYRKKLFDDNPEQDCKSSKIKHFVGDSVLIDSNYDFLDTYIELEEAKRGELLHRLVSEISYLECDKSDLIKYIEDKIDRISFELKINYDKNQILDEILKLLSHETLKEFFKGRENRVVLTEREIVDRMGNLYRVDRLVIEPNRVTLIEFKFGRSADEKEASKQTEKYIEILREIYPDRKLEGLIYFAHKNILKSV